MGQGESILSSIAVFLEHFDRLFFSIFENKSFIKKRLLCGNTFSGDGIKESPTSLDA